MQATAAARTRTASKVRDVAKTAPMPSALRDQAGRARVATAETAAEMPTMRTTFTRSESPISALAQSVRIPSPMLMPSAVG